MKGTGCLGKKLNAKLFNLGKFALQIWTKVLFFFPSFSLR